MIDTQDRHRSFALIDAIQDPVGAYVPVLAQDGTNLLATLDAAESSWVRIAATWQVAAQGPDGPVVVRDTGSTFEIASVDPIIDVRSQDEGQS